jgi:hypothetical protein
MTSTHHTASHTDTEQALSNEQVQWLKELHKTGKEMCLSISTDHKDIHASISKYGRAIDKVSWHITVWEGLLGNLVLGRAFECPLLEVLMYLISSYLLYYNL